MKFVPINGEKGENKFIIIDDNQYDFVINEKWYLNSKGYIIRNFPNKKRILLHRILTNCPKNMIIDHINRNKLDNRMMNLRICTNSENVQNKGKAKCKRLDHISKYNGLS